MDGGRQHSRLRDAASHVGLVRLLNYQRSDLRGDVIAGITVTAYLIPQVMAYSTIAGLSPQTGLWVIVATLVIYAVIGSSRLLSVGPESTTALMTAAALAPLAAGDALRYASLAAMLAILVGVLAIGAGLLRLGFLGELLSRPILVGYMAGVAVIMITSQLGKVTGVDAAGQSFVEDISNFAGNFVSQASWPTIALGACVTALLLILTPRFPRTPIPLLVMLAATAVVWIFDLEQFGIATVAQLDGSGPSFGVPSVAPSDTVALILPAIGILMVGYTDNLLTARIFAKPGQRIHNNQEFLALGAANVGAGLVSGFPVSSSASRTVIGRASGARTQMYSLVAAALVVAAVLAFAEVISQFPAAALGGLVIYAAIRLIDIREFKRLWHFRRREFLLALGATVGVLLFDILYGILVAIAISVVELLIRVARPHAAILGQNPQVAGWHDVSDYPQTSQIPGLVVFRYDSPLIFANADNFVRKCIGAIDSESLSGPVRWFLLNMEGNTEVDITGLDALNDVRKVCESRNIVLALVRVKKELIDDLDRYGITKYIGADHIYPTLPTAVQAYEKWAKDNP